MSTSPWLHEQHQKLIAAALDSSLAEDAQAYREAKGAPVMEIRPDRDTAEEQTDLPAPEGGAWT